MADVVYYVVEVRLPIQISEAASAEEAARKAARQFENEYHIDVSSWYMRVFEYGGDPDNVGVINEYFSNPSGSKFRNRLQNVNDHDQMIKEGKTPNDD